MREHKKSHLGIMGWAMFLAGAMSLGSCSSDETLESMEPKAITFGSVSMENHSRAAADPSYGDNKLIDGFQVWGTVKGNTNNTVNIFNGATVTRGTAEYRQPWTCSETQYWIPSATYNFMAIVDGNKTIKDANNNTKVISTTTVANGMPSAITYNADGITDLLLAEPVLVHTDDMAEPDEDDVNENGCVAFTMTHLLSKVHFTFQDGSGKPVANTTITDIQVTGHYASGTYTIGATNPWGTLTPAAEGESLNFGVATAYVNATTPVTSANARLIIPGTQTWSISFKLNGSTQTLELEDQTFEANQAYNLIVTLGQSMTLTKIVVADWEEVAVENEFANTATVSKEGRIKWTEGTYATLADNEIVLIDDINQPAEFKFTIDGPKGGTWHAMLVNPQGDPNAFELSQTQGRVDGNEVTIEVRATKANPSTANRAELHFVITKSDITMSVEALNYFVLDENGNVVENSKNGSRYVVIQSI